MAFVLWILIFLLGIFLVVKKVQNDKQKQNLPPGPWGLPLLGNLVSLGLNPHLKLMKWKEKYGPIIYMRFGSFPTLVLCDANVIKEAFGMAEFSGRPQLQVFMENNLVKGIGLSEGPYNTELRKFATIKLKEFGMGRKLLEDQIHGGIAEFLDFLKMREGLPIKSGDIPSAHIIRTLWSIMMTDELNPADAEHLNQTTKKLGQLGSAASELAGFMPWSENLTRIISLGHFSLISARSKQVQELCAWSKRLLKKKKTNWVKGQGQGQGQHREPTDMMDFYLEKVEETTDESSPFHASQGSAKFFLGDFLSGGIHTIHTSLVWTLNYIARNPDVQLKLQEEIDQVIGISRLTSLSDRGQMPYADAIIKEVLRISPSLPLGVPRKTTADVCFHGYNIKKDTMVFANLYGVHHDPEIWGDPENFRPERWFGESGKKLKNDNFLPFSTGRRNCPGESLAREQLFLYLTTLFQKYSVNFYREVPEVKEVIGVFLEASKFTIVFNQRRTNKS